MAALPHADEAGQLLELRLRSSTEANGPLLSRSATMRCAVAGPMPGSVSSSATPALLRFTLPEGAAPAAPAAASDAPDAAACCASSGVGTATCSPSFRRRARLRASDAAPSENPPAACTASATRAPEGSRYTPGAATAPLTCTHTPLPAASVPAPSSPPPCPAACASPPADAASAGWETSDASAFSSENPPPPPCAHANPAAASTRAATADTPAIRGVLAPTCSRAPSDCALF